MLWSLQKKVQENKIISCCKLRDKTRFSHLFVGSGRYSEESAMCAMLLPNMPKFPLYELSCLIFFLVPMLSIAVLYVRMGLRIQSNGLGHSIEGSVHGETRQAQSRKAIIRMLSKFLSFSDHSRMHAHTNAHTELCITQENVHTYTYISCSIPHRIYCIALYFIPIAVHFILSSFRDASLHILVLYKSHTIKFCITVDLFITDIVYYGERNWRVN